jgi:hypothetical protein
MPAVRRRRWQLIGTVDYVPNSWVTLQAGYQSSHFNYDSSGHRGLDVRMGGPIFAGNFRF